MLPRVFHALNGVINGKFGGIDLIKSVACGIYLPIIILEQDIKGFKLEDRNKISVKEILNVNENSFPFACAFGTVLTIGVNRIFWY